ncbi:hypothetical protein [Hymenobacter sp. YC55]|uniref:hypothetical protein n=1 Tax=Hymenobacter sp. YC55 TaxID=3034019 RepID=UPI0023F62622|nr:hypothetical protein [Hymenobacter sp. YC55]MDF7810930.1 hypothetical protein [Hymenobacter sp. YC55]
MRHRILEPINATDNLALLFNAYLRGLSTFDLVTVPRETMAECNAAFQREAQGDKPKHSITDQARRYYEMTVLCNSLHSVHRQVVGALALLENFLKTYQADLTKYAIEKRLKTIDEWGSDDETDWEPDGFDEEGQVWKVAYKDDPESLAPYSLHNELAGFFNGHDTRGEYIGTSHPSEFAVYTHAVATQTELSLRKMFSHGLKQDITLHSVGPEGEMVPVSLADQIEDELNEDLVNTSLANEFNAVLYKCEELGQLYREMAPDDLPRYVQLCGWLHKLVHEVPRFEPPKGFAAE